MRGWVGRRTRTGEGGRGIKKPKDTTVQGASTISLLLLGNFEVSWGRERGKNDPILKIVILFFFILSYSTMEASEEGNWREREGWGGH